MTTATYYSAFLAVDGGATGTVSIDDTTLLVVGARVVLIDKDSEPVQYKIKEIVSPTDFVVCNFDDTIADLSAYTVAKASRVTQYYQELDSIGDSPYVLKAGDHMTGPLSVEGGITATTVGVVFPDETLQITGVPDPTDKENLALFSDGSKYVLRAIRESDIQKVFAITGFSVSGGSLEVGATLTTPTLTASYNRPPTAAVLTDNAGTPSKDVIATPTSFSSAGTFTKTENNASVTFTLSAAENADTSTRNTSATWRPRAYYGAGAAGINTEAAIKALSNSTLAGSKSATITVTAGPSQYIYYAFPTAYGEPVFAVGGFEGGFELAAASVSVTNAFGVTQTYQVWKSVQPNLGTTTVVVS